MILTHTQLLLKALEFSADKHRHQRRKGTSDIPYINHPIQVASLIANVGQEKDTSLLIAAILHDTVEDTKTTIDEVKAIFGEEVADLVSEVTDDKNLKKQDRKRLQVEKAPYKSDKAKLIKIADKTCNVRDILNQPPDWDTARKLEYLDWAEKVVRALGVSQHPLLDYFNYWLNKGRSEIRD